MNQKGTYRKMASKNYNLESGIVGRYKGINVYCVSEKNYSKLTDKNNGYIYAISSGANSDLLLVLRNNVVGSMDKEGNVKECEPHPFAGLVNYKHNESNCPVGGKAEEITLEYLYGLSAPIDKYISEALGKEYL